MKQPNISVIIPVYNGCDYVDGLFEQFIEQQPRCFELIFVDDGSTDNSYIKLLKWQEKALFPVTVYHQENKGVSAARNAGLELAKGDYITYVDVDDALSRDYIKVLYECTKEKLDVVVFQSERITQSQWECPISNSVANNYINLDKNKQLNDFIQDPTKIGVFNLLVRRQYLKDNNISFAVGYKYYEDYNFLLELFAQTDAIWRIENVLYYYIMREGSAMGRFNEDRILCLKLMKDKEKWLQSYAPEFAPVFSKWGVARIYWSVLWQAALAFPTYTEFKKFTEITNATKYIKKLVRFPDFEVRISSYVFIGSKLCYWIMVRIIGSRRAKVSTVALSELEEKLRIVDEN